MTSIDPWTQFHKTYLLQQLQIEQPMLMEITEMDQVTANYDEKLKQLESLRGKGFRRWEK
jgi:hypothetical protein